MAKTQDRARYTLDEVQRNTFYQLPKFLFADEFRELSNDARILYSLMRERHELSIKNKWLNENQEVYIIFSRENMGAMLGLSRPTVIKVVNELKFHNLVQEERPGLGKPNRIYLLTVRNETAPKSPQTLENTKMSTDFPSGNNTASRPDVKNNYPNKKNLSKTNFSKGEGVNPPPNPRPNENIKIYGEYKHVHLTDTEYNELVSRYGQHLIDRYITILDLHMETSKKKYGNHCATIKQWIVKDEYNNSSKPKEKRNKFANFEGRKRNYEEIERLEREYLLKSVGLDSKEFSSTEQEAV